MPAELNRTADFAPHRSAAEHLQPRSSDGRTIKYRQLVSAIACLLPAVVLGGPKNGQVVVGEANISTPDANTTVIRQSTDKSVINWQSFSIGSQEYVKFVQPNQSSLSLNRVIGGDPSSILGKLSANGQVYLVNPNGIYFGQGAQVDVSAIVASVLDISNADFISGNFVFQGDVEQNLGKVINDGIINARNQGYVVLLGDYSENNGVIQAQMGKVVLASGSHITMDISANNLISVAVNEAAVSALAGVKNSGDIYADGGRVIMTARVADNLIGSAVNNEGLVRASSIVEQDGAIFLSASGGSITNSGTLDASAVAASNVDGGGVLVYSDRDITLTPASEINARGDGAGAGGMVRVIAEDRLDFQKSAAISVAGAPGHGGFVEISGHRGLAIRGDVDTGSGGQLLIDPTILTITNSNNIPGFTTGSTTNGFVGKGFVETQLNANTNVTLVASGSIRTAGGSLGGSAYTISAAGNGDLSLVNGNVGVGGTFGACSLTGVCLPGGGAAGVTPGPTGDINLGQVNINIGGALSIAAGSTAGNATVNGINAAGNVAITAGGNVNLQGNIAAAGTSLAVTAGGDIAIDGSIGIATNSGLLPLAADVNMAAGNDINVDGDIVVGNNSLNLFADAGVPNGAGDVNINGRGSCTDGCFGEPRTVTTRGAMNIAGVNLNVNGADFGSSRIFSSFDIPVRVSADDGIATTTTDNLTVNLSGQANIVGGGAIGVGNVDFDVSVQVSAGNDLTISANGLSVQGGNVAALASSADSSVATVKGNADVSAGRDISLTLNGALSIAGGNATATGYASRSTASAIGTASANAVMTAGRDVIVNSAASLSVFGGTATAVAGTGSVSCGTCSMTANANATVSGRNIITVSNVTGNIAIAGDHADVSVNAAPGTGTINFAIANVTANSNVLVTATQDITLNASGTIDIFGSFANATGSLASASIVAMNASASVAVNAGNDVTLNASGSLNIFGGFASAGGNTGGANWTGASTVVAIVKSDAQVTAGNNVNITTDTELNVFGGFAGASPNTAGATTGIASAGGVATVSAGGLATINVTTGSMFVFDGSDSPAGTIAGTPTRIGDANGRILAGSLNLSVAANLNLISGGELVALGGMQISAGVDVVGSSAGIFADGLYLAAGNNVSLSNTITSLGNGGAPGVSGDTLVLDILDRAGIGLPANNSPNAMFEAGGSMDTGDVILSASNSYLWFSADQLNVGSISAPAGPLLVQYSPFTPTHDIAFEDLPASPQALQVNYDNSNLVASLPMTTLVIGSEQQSGPMTVGANGMINIGARNILLLNSPESVTLPTNIITSGIVATSGFVASLGEEVFVTPRLDSFDVEVENWWLEAERRKQQLLENGDNDHGMCTAL